LDRCTFVVAGERRDAELRRALGAAAGDLDAVMRHMAGGA
jgi:hypothetical protein